MEYRQLGGSGFKVPVLSLGTGTFGGGNEFFKAWGGTEVAEATNFKGLIEKNSADIGFLKGSHGHLPEGEAEMDILPLGYDRQLIFQLE